MDRGLLLPLSWIPPTHTDSPQCQTYLKNPLLGGWTQNSPKTTQDSHFCPQSYSISRDRTSRNSLPRTRWVTAGESAFQSFPLRICPIESRYLMNRTQTYLFSCWGKVSFFLNLCLSRYSRGTTDPLLTLFM